MEELPPDAVLALQRGRMIEAIKIVRNRTGLDLKSAKEAVDRYADRLASGEDDNDHGRGAPAAAMQDRGFASMHPSRSRPWRRATGSRPSASRAKPPA